MTVSTEKLKNSFIIVWGILVFFMLFFCIQCAGMTDEHTDIPETTQENENLYEKPAGIIHNQFFETDKTDHEFSPETESKEIPDTSASEEKYVFAEHTKLEAIEVDGTLYIPLEELFLSAYGDSVSASGGSFPEIAYIENINSVTIGERAFFGGHFYIDGGIICISDSFAAELFDAEYDCGILYDLNIPDFGESYYDSEDLLWLSSIISAEARGECFEGKLAVGSVVLNRTESDHYPDTIHDVVFDTVGGIQFSPASSGSIYKDPTEESVLAAKVCLEGYRLDRSILFFYNPKISTSTYFTEKRTFVTSIGNHDFFS